MQFVVETACITDRVTVVIPSPETRIACVAVGALEPGSTAGRLLEKGERKKKEKLANQVQIPHWVPNQHSKSKRS